MHFPTDKNAIGLLLLINRLLQTNQRLGRQTISPFAELKLPEVARNYDYLVHYLLGNQLAEGTVESFLMTPDGADLVRDVSREHSLHAWFYNEYYQAVLRSKAHSLFCERVYGKDLCQHGMADMAQIHLLLAELQVRGGMALLDFGCGDGRISEYISDTTQTLVSGVDIADEAIRLALARTQMKRERLRFLWADIERGRGTFPHETFDRICAIDSIFFVQSQRTVLQVLLSHLAPEGIMAVSYICPPQVTAERTMLAESLKELGLSYSTHDLSVENTKHWTIKKQVLLELEPLFREEGNEFLFKNRLAECDGLEQFRRYLYIITTAQVMVRAAVAHCPATPARPPARMAEPGRAGRAREPDVRPFGKLRACFRVIRLFSRKVIDTVLSEQPGRKHSCL